MIEILNKSAVVVDEDVVSCDLDGEIAILNMKNGVYYGLNPVGSQIWNLLQKPKTVEELSEAICKDYDVEKETCRKDVSKLIEDLLDNGLVKLNE